MKKPEIRLKSENLHPCLKPIQLRRKTIRVGYWHWLGHTFALPNAKDTNMLVSFVLGDANFLRHPTQNPNASSQREPSSQLNMGLSVLGHVNYLYVLLTLGSLAPWPNSYSSCTDRHFNSCRTHFISK